MFEIALSEACCIGCHAYIAPGDPVCRLDNDLFYCEMCTQDACEMGEDPSREHQRPDDKEGSTR